MLCWHSFISVCNKIHLAHLHLKGSHKRPSRQQIMHYRNLFIAKHLQLEQCVIMLWSDTKIELSDHLYHWHVLWKDMIQGKSTRYPNIQYYITGIEQTDTLIQSDVKHTQGSLGVRCLAQFESLLVQGLELMTPWSQNCFFNQGFAI